jgi:hypothetical protein
MTGAREEEREVFLTPSTELDEGSTAKVWLVRRFGGAVVEQRVK